MEQELKLNSLPFLVGAQIPASRLSTFLGGSFGGRSLCDRVRGGLGEISEVTITLIGVGVFDFLGVVAFDLGRVMSDKLARADSRM